MAVNEEVYKKLLEELPGVTLVAVSKLQSVSRH